MIRKLIEIEAKIINIGSTIILYLADPMGPVNTKFIKMIEKNTNILNISFYQK